MSYYTVHGPDTISFLETLCPRFRQYAVIGTFGSSDIHPSFRNGVATNHYDYIRVKCCFCQQRELPKVLRGPKNDIYGYIPTFLTRDGHMCKFCWQYLGLSVWSSLFDHELYQDTLVHNMLHFLD